MGDAELKQLFDGPGGLRLRIKNGQILWLEIDGKFLAFRYEKTDRGTSLRFIGNKDIKIYRVDRKTGG